MAASRHRGRRGSEGHLFQKVLLNAYVRKSFGKRCPSVPLRIRVNRVLGLCPVSACANPMHHDAAVCSRQTSCGPRTDLTCSAAEESQLCTCMRSRAFGQQDEVRDDASALVCTRLTATMRRRLRVYCAENDTTASAFLREAVERALQPPSDGQG